MNDWSYISNMGRVGVKREEIVNAGFMLMYERGFHGTGIQDIAKRAGVPKGSFYNYFKSKEDFAVELLGHYHSKLVEKLSLFTNTDQRGFEKIISFFRAQAQDFAETGFKYGCFLGNLSLEMSDVSTAIQTRAKELFSLFIDRIETTIEEGMADGSIKSSLVPSELAALCLDGFEGATLRMKAEKSPNAGILFLKYLTMLLEETDDHNKNEYPRDER